MYGDPARARGLSRSMGRINFENAPACESRGLRDRPHPRYCRTERPQRLEIIRLTEVAVYAHFKLQVQPGQLRSFAWKRRNADSYFFFLSSTAACAVAIDRLATSPLRTGGNRKHGACIAPFDSAFLRCRARRAFPELRLRDERNTTEAQSVTHRGNEEKFYFSADRMTRHGECFLTAAARCKFKPITVTRLRVSFSLFFFLPLSLSLSLSLHRRLPQAHRPARQLFLPPSLPRHRCSLLSPLFFYPPPR